MMNDPRLAEMLCTKLCHDLTGPIGAIANGAEFLTEEDSQMDGQAIELISQSAQEAVYRLQFYRQAYGRVNHGGEASLCDAKLLVEDYFSSGKIALDWPDQFTDAANISISRRMARLLFNMVLALSTSLIRGGTLAVRLEQHGQAKKILLAASGPTLKWDSSNDEVLEGHIALDDITPYTVQLYYTKQLCEQLGVHIQAQLGEQTLEMSAIQHEPELVG